MPMIANPYKRKLAMENLAIAMVLEHGFSESGYEDREEYLQALDVGADEEESTWDEESMQAYADHVEAMHP